MFGIDFQKSTSVHVAHGAIDFRCGIDKLVSVCVSVLKLEPTLPSAIFAFRNRASDAIKILFYDGTGYWLCQKRLSKSKFKNWPAENEPMTQCGLDDFREIISTSVKSKSLNLPWERIK